MSRSNFYFSTIIFFAITASHLTAEPGTMPEQPVTAESLSKEEYAAFKRPMEVDITRLALTDEAGPMSFTSGLMARDLNFLSMHGGFEPVAWRPLIRPSQNSEPGSNIIHIRRMGDVYDGLFDGARVRVYQMIDGKLTKIRDARVVPGGHRSGKGWNHVRYGSLHTKPDVTEFPVVFDKNARLNAPYWLIVRAVYEGGLSADSEAVRVVPDSFSNEKKPKPYQDQLSNRIKPLASGQVRVEPPKNLRVNFKEGIAHLSWDAAPPNGLLGYSVHYSEIDPKDIEEPQLTLDSREPHPDRDVQANDLVFVDQFTTEFRKADAVDNFQWNEVGYWPEAGLSGFTFWPDEDPAKTWRLVEHAKPIPPEMIGIGKTCLEMQSKNDGPIGIELLRVGGSDQDFYTVLDAVPHTFEAWVRGSGRLQLQFAGPYAEKGGKFPYPTWNTLAARAAGEFPMPPIDVPLTNEWSKVSVSFTPPGVPKTGQGSIYLTFNGPGEFQIDNVALYETARGKGNLPESTVASLRDSGMELWRTHELIKSKWGYSLDGMIGDVGNNNYIGGRFRIATFFNLLQQMKRVGVINPWLQIEMCLAEEEWLGFAEWLCAPYDPAKGDTPEKKPYAYQRWSMGQEKPWIDEFPRFAFEVANETWNSIFAPYMFRGGLTDSVTGRRYEGGEEYGIFNEYVIGLLRQSPYWTEANDQKTTYVICGWAASPFGVLAKRHSPSSHIITSAAYNANDGIGDPKVFTDFKVFYQMQWTPSAVAQQTEREAANRHQLLREGRPVDWGMYEFGPNYHVMPGDPAEAKEVDQRLARGMCAAVYVLDSVLHRARAGFTEQAFFTFEHETGPWGTHTLPLYGAHPYPKFKAMTLYNHFGKGRFLECNIQSSPTWNFPEYESMDNFKRIKRRKLDDCPLISVYAAADGDRLCVFLLSRKLDNFPVLGDDGFTPVSVNLPFDKAKKTTLYKLTGDPRIDDRFKENHHIEKVELDPPIGNKLQVNEKTGGDARGLPPASIFCYVFEGTNLQKLNSLPLALIDDMKQVPVGQPVTLVNRSSDPEDGQPDCVWNIDGVGTFNGFSPEVTFPIPGQYTLTLEARDKTGATARDSHVVQAVQRDPADRLWTRTEPPERITGDLLFDGDRVRLESDRRASAIIRDEFSGDFEVEAVIEAIESTHPNPGFKAKASRAGISLAGQSAWSNNWQPSGIGSIEVALDGSVTTSVKTGATLPPGSVPLPAHLKISVSSGSARFAVRLNGTEKELAIIENINAPFHPGIIVATPGNGSATFQNIQIKHN